jgi:hypothetical protein
VDSLQRDTQTNAADQVIVASYLKHQATESALRLLCNRGVSLRRISLIGYHFEPSHEVQGFYQPAPVRKSYEDAQGYYRLCPAIEDESAITTKEQSSWAGGIFTLIQGAMGFFVLPVVGGVMIIGPLASLVAHLVDKSGVCPLMQGLVAIGISQEGAMDYRTCLQSGAFLVVLQGAAHEVGHAEQVLYESTPQSLKTHTIR